MAVATGLNSPTRRPMTRLMPVKPMPMVTPDLNDFATPAPIMIPKRKMMIGNMTVGPMPKMVFNNAMVRTPVMRIPENAVYAAKFFQA